MIKVIERNTLRILHQINGRWYVEDIENHTVERVMPASEDDTWALLDKLLKAEHNVK